MRELFKHSIVSQLYWLLLCVYQSRAARNRNCIAAVNCINEMAIVKRIELSL